MDREMELPVVDEIRDVVAEWAAQARCDCRPPCLARRQGKYSCALSPVTHDRQLTANSVRDWLSVHEQIVHSTIEIHHCEDTGAGA